MFLNFFHSHRHHHQFCRHHHHHSQGHYHYHLLGIYKLNSPPKDGKFEVKQKKCVKESFPPQPECKPCYELHEIKTECGVKFECRFVLEKWSYGWALQHRNSRDRLKLLVKNQKKIKTFHGMKITMPCWWNFFIGGCAVTKFHCFKLSSLRYGPTPCCGSFYGAKEWKTSEWKEQKSTERNIFSEILGKRNARRILWGLYVRGNAKSLCWKRTNAAVANMFAKWNHTSPTHPAKFLNAKRNVPDVSPANGYVLFDHTGLFSK